MNSAGFSDWVCVRERRPFVQHLTNAISASFQADVINALGGRCMMSHHPEEVGAIAARADALLINIGAPDADSSLRYRRALDVAQLRGIPVVLDPVGYGFTPIRSEIIDSLLKEYSFSIIRGNGGEIALLAGMQGDVCGVDGSSSIDVIHEAVSVVAKRFSCVCAATGEADCISDGSEVAVLKGGTPVLGRISGSGCALGSVMGLLLAVCSPMTAAKNAITLFNCAAVEAAKKSEKPGSFKAYFIDAMVSLSEGSDGDGF